VTVVGEEPYKTELGHFVADMTAPTGLGSRNAEGLVVVAALAKDIPLRKVHFAEVGLLVAHNRIVVGRNWAAVGEPLRPRADFRSRGAP